MPAKGVHLVDKVHLWCVVCGKEMLCYPSLRRITCSKECRYRWQKIRLRDPRNNSNYGHRWTKERRDKWSVRLKALLSDPKRRELCGRANRGKRFSQERRKKMRVPKLSLRNRLVSEETRKKIGIASSRKFTSEFKAKFHTTMEERGHWRRRGEGVDFDTYREEANWVEGMIGFCSIEERDRLNKVGMWNPRNQGGLVRDHKYSRKSGFEFGVFPELLRHPVNLQLLPHGENSAKSRRKTFRDSISLQELFDGIRSYQEDWKEQDSCLDLIDRYEKGERWGR